MPLPYQGRGSAWECHEQFSPPPVYWWADLGPSRTAKCGPEEDKAYFEKHFTAKLPGCAHPGQRNKSGTTLIPDCKIPTSGEVLLHQKVTRSSEGEKRNDSDIHYPVLELGELPIFTPSEIIMLTTVTTGPHSSFAMQSYSKTIKIITSKFFSSRCRTPTAWQ